MFLNKDVKALLESLILQARSQWGCQPPVTHPEMRVTFSFSSGRPDRDNRLTAILDCLQKAGVILNDNAKQFNGRLTLEPARFVKAGKEQVEVEISA